MLGDPLKPSITRYELFRCEDLAGQADPRASTSCAVQILDERVHVGVILRTAACRRRGPAHRLNDEFRTMNDEVRPEAARRLSPFSTGFPELLVIRRQGLDQLVDILG